jgi:hypothetical protein
MGVMVFENGSSLGKLMHVTFILPPVGMADGVKVIAIYAQQLKQMGRTVRIISPPRARLTFGRKLKSWLNGSGWIDDRTAPKSHLDGSGIDHQVLDRFRPIIDDDVLDGDIVIATFWLTAEWVARLSDRRGQKFILSKDTRAMASLRMLALELLIVCLFIKLLFHSGSKQ